MHTKIFLTTLLAGHTALAAVLPRGERTICNPRGVALPAGRTYLTSDWISGKIPACCGNHSCKQQKKRINPAVNRKGLNPISGLPTPKGRYGKKVRARDVEAQDELEFEDDVESEDYEVEAEDYDVDEEEADDDVSDIVERDQPAKKKGRKHRANNKNRPKKKKKINPAHNPKGLNPISGLPTPKGRKGKQPMVGHPRKQKNHGGINPISGLPTPKGRKPQPKKGPKKGPKQQPKKGPKKDARPGPKQLPKNPPKAHGPPPPPQPAPAPPPAPKHVPLPMLPPPKTGALPGSPDGFIGQRRDVPAPAEKEEQLDVFDEGLSVTDEDEENDVFIADDSEETAEVEDEVAEDFEEEGEDDSEATDDVAEDAEDSADSTDDVADEESAIVERDVEDDAPDAEFLKAHAEDLKWWEEHAASQN